MLTGAKWSKNKQTNGLRTLRTDFLAWLRFVVLTFRALCNAGDSIQSTYYIQHCMLCVLAYNKSLCPRQTNWVPKIQRFYNVLNKWNNLLFFTWRFIVVLTDMYVKLSNSDREHFLPFLMFLVTNRGLIRYYDRLYLAPAVTSSLKARNVVSDWLIEMNRCSSATRLVSRLREFHRHWLGFFFFFVTWCLSTNGRIGFKRVLMDQSRKGCYALFPEKHAAPRATVALFECTVTAKLCMYR